MSDRFAAARLALTASARQVRAEEATADGGGQATTSDPSGWSTLVNL